MSIDLPSGSLAAEQIILRLAQPIADEDGFVELQKLVAVMKREEDEGTGVFPSDLRGDQVVDWLSLKMRYLEHAHATEVARIIGHRVEVLPDLIDNNMLSMLKQHLSGPEQEHLFITLSNYDRFRFYWKAKDIYRNGGFRRDDVARLRAWARHRISGWP